MMRLYAIVLILNFQLTRIFACPPNSHELSLQINNDVKGYECGKFFFTDNEVKDTLTVARDSIDKGYLYPQRYRGKLYVESEFEEYLIYPIQNGRLLQPHFKVMNTVFRVVFARNSDEVVDVIAKITNGDYVKCIPRGSTNIGLSHAMPGTQSGYLCGHEFFTDETIDKNLALAQKDVVENSKFLRPYDGNVHPENTGLLTWPIMTEDYLYKFSRDRTGPYKLILSKERKIVDVVAKGFQKNYLRCLRARKPPKAPASDHYSKLFVQPPKYGYICAQRFFNEGVIEQTAKTLRSKANLIEYSGPPFYQPCLIWPILFNGKPFRSGPKGPYRLVLTPQHKVITVAMYADGIYKACEKNTILAKKKHDTSSYQCGRQIFRNYHLEIAAEQACASLNAVKLRKYPAIYDGPEFEKEGPYLTYPVFEKTLFRNTAGSYRVVINKNCEVAGALTTLKNGNSKRLVKCHRLDDGPLPSKFFGANAQTVFEYQGENLIPNER